MGNRLRALLKAKGMTQRDLAEALGIGAPTIAKYVSGLSAPSPERAAKIARLLGADPKDLGAREQKARGPQAAGALDAAALDAALERHSISPAELARRVGRTPQAIYSYRLGKNRPSIATLRRMARELDLDPADLVKPEADEPPAKPARSRKPAAKPRR